MILDEMRERFAAALAEGRALCEKANTEKRPPTDEERTKFDTLMAESDTLRADIERQEKLEERKGWASAAPNPGHRPQHGSTPGGDARTLTMGEEFQAIALASAMVAGARFKVEPHVERRAVELRRGESRAITGMNETIGSEGGFLLKPEYEQGILKNVYSNGVVAARCDRRTLGAGFNSLTVTMIDESSRADGYRAGGLHFYWLEEAGAKTLSQPKYRQVTWKPKKVAALYRATDELLQDAASLEQELNAIFSEELAYELDRVIIAGTGAGQPQGVLNAPALISVAKEAGQAAKTFTYKNALTMWSSGLASRRQNMAWFINQDVEPQLNAMHIVVGVGGLPVYLPATGAAGAPYSTLFNRPVIPIEQCSTLGTVGDVILADMSDYRLVDMGSSKMDSSIHLRFDYDETTFRMVYRVDGSLKTVSRLTPASGSTNYLGPVIVCAVRA